MEQRRLSFLVLLLCLMPALLWAQDDKVNMMPSGGVYKNTFPVTMTCRNHNLHIRYTLNGATPDHHSALYTHPLLLSDGMYSTSDIYKIQDSPEEEFFLPSSVMKAVVIRAAAFDDFGHRVTPVVTQSYFVRSLDCDLHGLPIVSICADSSALFDYDTGIMVQGALFDPNNSETTGNYIQSGREWERKVNVEFYADGKECFNQAAGLRTHGGSRARRAQQKGLKLYAREEYGKKNFKYKIFEETELKKFKHLVLRPFRNACTPAGVHNWLANQIASNLNIGVTASRPVTLFLNGEYWGIYFLEEKADDRYIESHYGVDHDSINIISCWGELESGTSDSFYSLYYWLMGADLSDSVTYYQFAERIDVPNIIDYYIFELFAANWDWPVNNVRCWQKQDDGQWHWLFYDGDCCFDNMGFDVYANAVYTGPLVWPTAEWSTLFFRKLLESPIFKNQFISRLQEVNREHFSYNRTGPLLDKICHLLKDEIPQQSQRFNNPQNMKRWESSCRKIDDFLAHREDRFWYATKTFFHAEEDNIQTLFCYPNPLINGDNLNILISTKAECVAMASVFDLNGRLVRNHYVFLLEGDNHVTFDMRGLSGMYVIKVGEHSTKVFVQER